MAMNLMPSAAGAAARKESVAVFQERKPDGGVIRLERWPDAYILWFNGEIVWKCKRPQTPVPYSVDDPR